ncbi:hypothetical protein UFOVP116_152 [uncultured Caudovirales phage]|uniref:Uncharacterized protein n=1 Tax=uncultured Caudovirales phage TaxID=2100421 RepID=A0A6J5L6Y6_9CAUD|nr:hypothetical protein UFOVP116_152 [uncultured Caudovirales phage]
MRLYEITSSGRKTIKKLSSSYMEFLLGYVSYNDLTDFVNQCVLSNDADVNKEALFIQSQLSALIFSKLRNESFRNIDSDENTGGHQWMDRF